MKIIESINAVDFDETEDLITRAKKRFHTLQILDVLRLIQNENEAIIQELEIQKAGARPWAAENLEMQKVPIKTFK
ncbi:hypothetical protein OXYTRIMIC_277 [Oxytricha trifallax]|uniref:Uncharacterized protein n=1 Tax=Oxytricha trifallax TaxID=1172189 RepID=A0A073IB73_9SPIT|nr:hypothetical protein OXYTRIMIC_277 [Oxytricha trifallax]